MILHTVQSTKTQGSDNSLIGPTAWNQDHTLEFPLQFYSGIGGTLLFQLWNTTLITPNGSVTANFGDLCISSYSPYTTNSGGLWLMTGTSGTNIGWVQIASSGSGSSIPSGNAGGDVGGSYPASLIVHGINNVTLSSLATGLLKITTGTGVPSIAGSSDITSALGFTPLNKASNLSDVASVVTSRSNLQIFQGTQTASIVINALTFTAGYNAFQCTLNANITSFTMPAGQFDGQVVSLIFLHDGTSTNYSVASPSNLRGLFTPGSVASKYNVQSFIWNSSASVWLAQGVGSVNI